MNVSKEALAKMIHLLQNGKTVALPTESVYGLSCILTPDAVQKVMKLKQRDASKGFIILSSQIEHLLTVIDVNALSAEHMNQLTQQQEQTITWVVPVNNHYRWLTGQFNTIAIRLTTHPLLSLLTKGLNQAIISTSANIANMPPATSAQEVSNYFAEKIDYVYPQTEFMASKPSRLINLLTGQILRD